jgi:molybdopterin molybdotransferase
MISVEEAEKIIFENILSQNTEGPPLQKTVGRVLAEDLVADRDFPPFDRVTMDGIAIHFDSFKNGQRIFAIENTQAAGAPALVLMDKTHCIEVMTGAMLPEGCDTVIRYEDLKIEDRKAEIGVQNIDYQQNTHKKGSDRKQGETLVHAFNSKIWSTATSRTLSGLRGLKITAAEISTAATIGKTTLQVVKKPTVAVISTGDELVDIPDTPLPYQIRRSNVYAIAALLEDAFKIEAQLFHFIDDKALIVKGLETILNDFDVFILSGAVSEGKFDFVPNALKDLGVEKLFHKVSQRPGKPFWFGKLDKKAVVFALPGNPVSTFMCACRYVLPFIEASMGIEPVRTSGVLLEDVIFKPDLTYFVPVKIISYHHAPIVKALTGNGSGDLANLNEADGFLELPKDKTEFKAGEYYPLIRYRF